jgi:predicted secreted hydrolase
MWVALLLLFLATGPSYRQVLPGYSYHFPEDHFDHPAYRTEWWYYTGNLRTSSGHRYGFELVFFRQGQRRGPSDNPSSWRIDDLYLAHLALTDIDRGTFRYFERLNRAGPGIAGASLASRRIWNANWSSQWEGEVQTLDATAEDLRLHLRLKPVKPLVIHGENGVSQKAAGEGRASCYLSFPRLAVDGQLNGQSVQGTAWMDHEWFTHQLEPEQSGWDWFSAQFSEGTELMLFQLRHKDGSLDPYSSGTYIDRQGRPRHLRREEFILQPLAWWTSPETGARYPIRWRIEIPALRLSIECSAAVARQELAARDSASPSYWEGAVTYAGTSTGVGYLEMTGYQRPMRLD